MEELIAALLARSTEGGALDEHRFIVEQSKLTVESRCRVRRSPQLARLCFGLEGLEATQVASFYWDTTTLCMRRPLLEYVNDGARVLEIGPGPSATMSLFVSKHKHGLQLTGCELNSDFVRSAREIANANGQSLEILESDMTAAVAGRQFDVMLMNPPYMKTAAAVALHQEHELDTAIGRASYADESGCAIVVRFLAEVPSLLARSGIALLGINTWYLEDDAVTQRIADSRMRLSRRYYPAERVAPNGPYSQVYVLTHR